MFFFDEGSDRFTWIEDGGSIANKQVAEGNGWSCSATGGTS